MSMKGTKRMPSTPTTMIMKDYSYVTVVLLSLLLLGSPSLSSEAFLLSPPSTSSRAVFTVNPPTSQSSPFDTALRVASVPYFATTATETSAKSSTKSDEAASTSVNQGGGGSNNNNDDSDDPYARIGINEDALAISINPEEVLKYIGTREDLIQKTLSDIPKMQRQQAEIEVDKFFLDADALQVFIEFKKRREDDPDFVVPAEQDEDGGLFSIRNVVYFYLAYVVYSSGPIAIREYVQSQVEAGTWKGTGIPQLDEWLLEAPTAAATATATAVAALTDTASSSLLSASDASSVVSDTIVQAAQLVSNSLT